MLLKTGWLKVKEEQVSGQKIILRSVLAIVGILGIFVSVYERTLTGFTGFDLLMYFCFSLWCWGMADWLHVPFRRILPLLVIAIAWPISVWMSHLAILTPQTTWVITLVGFSVLFSVVIGHHLKTVLPNGWRTSTFTLSHVVFKPWIGMTFAIVLPLVGAWILLMVLKLMIR